MKKKIARFVIGSTSTGGAERQMSLVLPELVKLGWHIRLVTLNPVDGVFTPLLLANGITISKPRQFRLTKGIFGLINKFFVILYHLYSEFKNHKNITTIFMMSHSVLFGVSASIIARDSCKKIISIRNEIDRQYNPILRLYERLLYRVANKIIVNSNALLKYLVSEESQPEKKISIVNNAIDFKQFENSQEKTAIKQSLSLKQDSLIFMNVARLVEFKGHEETIESLYLAKQDLSQLTQDNWKFLFVGDGPMRNHLEKMVKKFSLEEHVLFLGERHDVADLLNICDVFVFPSHAEGMPNSLMEAICAGCEIIASDIPYIRELVGDELNLVPIKSPKLLAGAIVEKIKFFSSQTRSSELKTLMEAKHNISHVCNQWEKVLLEQ